MAWAICKNAAASRKNMIVKTMKTIFPSGCIVLVNGLYINFKSATIRSKRMLFSTSFRIERRNDSNILNNIWFTSIVYINGLRGPLYKYVSCVTGFCSWFLQQRHEVVHDIIKSLYSAFFAFFELYRDKHVTLHFQRIFIASAFFMSFIRDNWLYL